MKILRFFLGVEQLHALCVHKDAGYLKVPSLKQHVLQVSQHFYFFFVQIGEGNVNVLESQMGISTPGAFVATEKMKRNDESVRQLTATVYLRSANL